MTKKDILKKIKYSLRFVPDRIFLQIYYFARFKRFINFKNPKTYNEKLNWLKLHDREEIYVKLVDKYDVKKLVSKIIGEEYIIPTIGVWDTFDEINFDNLPEQFVLKCTHDSEGVYIVKNKHKLNINDARRKINRAMKYNFYYIGREWPYKNIKPRIIAEKYMEDHADGELRDYKFFCFNGVAKMMFIATDRSIGNTKFDYYDLNYNHLDLMQHYPNSEKVIEKPKNFDKMIQFSEKISKQLNLKHARIDFYEVDGKLYFGEITFYHFSGLQPFKPKEWDKKIGDLLVLDIESDKK